MKPIWASAMRWHLSLKASARGLALIGIIGGSVGLIAVLLSEKQEAATLPLKSGMSLQDFQIASHDEDRLQMRVSGDSLALSKAQLWGPFRLGFAHALVVRNLKVELFSESATDSSIHSLPASFKQTWTSAAPSLTHLLQSLALQNGGGVVLSVQLSPLQVVEYRAGRTTVLLKAASCKTVRTLTSLVCTDGFVRVGEQERLFKNWRSDFSVK